MQISSAKTLIAGSTLDGRNGSTTTALTTAAAASAASVKDFIPRSAVLHSPSFGGGRGRSRSRENFERIFNADESASLLRVCNPGSPAIFANGRCSQSRLSQCEETKAAVQLSTSDYAVACAKRCGRRSVGSPSAVFTWLDGSAPAVADPGLPRLIRLLSPMWQNLLFRK